MNTNPPIQAGWRLMAQSAVTPEMTAFAVDLLHEAQATNLAIGDARIKSFGDGRVLARVEWHPPDSNNAAVHVGITLYEPTAPGG